MLTTDEIVKNFPALFKKMPSGHYSYFFGEGKEAHFNEKEQMMVAGTYKPVGCLIMKRNVETIDDVKQFFKDLNDKMKSLHMHSTINV